MLKFIEKKILSNERLNRVEALELFITDDIFTVFRLANLMAERINGRRVFFIFNRHINPTNICINRCKFCAFSRSKGEAGAYELTIEEIIRKIENTQYENKKPLSEVHIVGGLHPDWTHEYYLKMISSIKNNFPAIAIKAFTAVEVDYMSKISGLDIDKTLLALKNSGLDIMPGGGAEIFSIGIRQRLCPEKISGERWLQIMESAHKIGIKTNASMLYGHIETFEDRVDHLMRLRALQDTTRGFQAFIPLAYHPKNTEIGGSISSGIDDLRTIAASRLILDNFAHIKAYWIMLGEKISQVALLCGADDIDGTIIEEKITHSAGAASSEGMGIEQLIHLIKKANKLPAERDAFYNIVNSG